MSYVAEPILCKCGKEMRQFTWEGDNWNCQCGKMRTAREVYLEQKAKRDAGFFQIFLEHVIKPGADAKAEKERQQREDQRVYREMVESSGRGNG
jgi:hypothetical protein